LKSYANLNLLITRDHGLTGSSLTHDIGDCYSHVSLSTKELDWQPKVGLRHGLQQTMAYYQAHDLNYWDKDIILVVDFRAEPPELREAMLGAVPTRAAVIAAINSFQGA
jgi:hypothetical protein